MARYEEVFSSLRSGFEKDVENAQKKITDIESAETDVKDMLTKAESDKEVARAEGREEGFEDGLKQAGQAGGSDKLYSDAEMNAERETVAAATAKPLNEKIEAQAKDLESLQAEVDELKAKGEKSTEEMNAAVEAARTELKAQFVADVKAVDMDNQAMLKKYEETPKAPSEPATGEESTAPSQEV